MYITQIVLSKFHAIGKEKGDILIIVVNEKSSKNMCSLFFMLAPRDFSNICGTHTYSNGKGK